MEEDNLLILRKIAKKTKQSQRQMAVELGFSLGKLNYCLKELKEKGFIKIQNFNKSQKKINYFYALTPKGISSKTLLTINFMKKKMKEYDELKSELQNSENLQNLNDAKKKLQKKIDYDLL
ncbi:MarR family EPS-associated transcriptional regulator [Candidatus Pelagibacter sp.]|nr:MarR family EPS-associated transcriptional regulator [Candidatus Pelagibacter sp.]